MPRSFSSPISCLTFDLTTNDLHLFPKSGTLKQIRAAKKKGGFKYMSADITWQATSNKAGNAAQREVRKILRQGKR